MRRFLILTFVFLLLAGLAGGLGYFQFFVKPEMIKGFIAKAPPPVATVAVTEAKKEEWVERIQAVGTFRAVQGIELAPQIGGVIRAFHFDSGQEVANGTLLVELDDSVEQADLKSNLATLKNADKRLKPGMFANVAVLVGKAQSLVTLPRTGVTYSLYGDSVYVVKPAPVAAGSAQAAPADQMIVERRSVKLGDARGARVSILSGLEPGEQVVSEGQSKLMAGARVRVDNSLALPASLNPLPRQ